MPLMMPLASVLVVTVTLPSTSTLERRSVKDAICRWQGVSDLPAAVRATRCVWDDDFAVGSHAVNVHRRSGRPSDAVGVGVVTRSGSVGGAAGWSVVDFVRHCDDVVLRGNSVLSGDGLNEVVRKCRECSQRQHARCCRWG
jgi:hypothetical protein